MTGAEQTTDHDHGNIDPHAWLDPANAQVWLPAIAEALATLDPENAAAYRVNAEAAARDLQALADALADRLEPLRGRTYIVQHDAYGYFEARFGLNALAALTAADGSAPGPARLREAMGAAAQAEARCLLVEPGADPRLAGLAATEADLPVVTADPLGAALSPGPDLYSALLEALAAAFVSCLD